MLIYVKKSKLVISLVLCWTIFNSFQMVYAEEANVIDQSSYHRLGLISISSGFSGGLIGGELLFYEYIGKQGLSLRIVPFNIYLTLTGYTYQDQATTKISGVTITTSGDTTVGFANYAPIWVRYYFGYSANTSSFFIGLGAVYHVYMTTVLFGDDIVKKSIRPAAEIGYDLGGTFVRASCGLKFFMGSGEKEDKGSIMLFSSLLLNWAS